MITTSSVDPHPKSRTDLAATWPPTSDVAREAGQEAERFTELDDNANQTTPADTPNSNHEPRVRRTRAATP